MTHLAVLVRLHDAVVETRLVKAVDGLVLGDVPGAPVGFPGGRLTAHREPGGGWSLGGRPLRPGRPVVFRFGDVEVTVEAASAGPGFAPHDAWPDPRLVVGALAVLLLVLGLQRAAAVVDAHPELAAGLAARLLSSPAASP